MENEGGCKTLQELMIPQPSSSSARKLVYVSTVKGNVTTHTVICSPLRD
jgi:hypothetical protein